jgi:hypothetical protein
MASQSDDSVFEHKSSMQASLGQPSWAVSARRAFFNSVRLSVMILVDCSAAWLNVEYCMTSRWIRAASLCSMSRDESNSVVGYSITSSARASSVGGISRPSGISVVRLTTMSNLTGLLNRNVVRLRPRKILGIDLSSIKGTRFVALLSKLITQT